MRLSEDSTDLPSIKGFTITRQIGRGGFSTVFSAVQNDMGRDVAIKVLNSGFETERQQRTFERECEVMGKVSLHPGIVTVHLAVQTTDGRPGIVMELYQSTYRDRLRANGPLTVEEALDVGVRMADALHAVHAAGILHRDIKPHNIFIGAYGPALADFGISSITGERSITGGGGFSLDYSAPEVLGEAEPGRGADIYALGATLYHLLSGEVPFPHTGNPADRLRVTVGKIVSAPPPTLSRQGSPDSLARLLRRCMAKDIAHRPESGTELADALRAVQRELGFAPTPSPNRRSDFVADYTPQRPPTPTDDATNEREPQSVTIARTHAGARANPPVTEPEPAVTDQSHPSPTRRRRVLIAAGVVTCVVAVIGAVGIALGGGDDGDTATPQTSELTPVVGDDAFQVLMPPTGLSATNQADGSVLVEWSPVEGDVRYQVSLIGSASEPETVDTTSMIWPASEGGSACFEVRTVADGRISAGRAGPACATD